MFEFFIALVITIVVVGLTAVFAFLVKSLFLLCTGTIAILFPICLIVFFIITMVVCIIAFVKWLVKKLF